MFDADGHIFEKDSEIFDCLEPPFRNFSGLKKSRLFPSGDIWNKTILNIIDGIEDDKVRDVGPQAWIDFLDQAELEGTVLYPSSGTRIGFIRETEWAVALARAYNIWLSERFLRASPRLKGIAILPLQDIDQAVAELRRAVTELGMVAGLLPGVGPSRLLGDRYYDPVYHAAQDLDIPVVIHGGATLMAGLDGFDRAIKARTLTHPFAQCIQLTDIMFSGVFDRFPKLRIGFMEAGIGWGQFLMDRMARSMDLGWSVEAPEMKVSPREHMTSGRLYFHCEMDEEILPFAVKIFGDNVMLYASDFPHQSPQYCLEDRQKFLRRQDLSEETKARVLGENAKRFYRL